MDAAGQRFLYYADKIMVLIHSPPHTSDEPHIGWEAFQALSNHPRIRGRPLLPRLQTLFISTLSTHLHTSILFNTLYPSIRNVAIRRFDDSNLQINFLSTLVSRVPEIHHLRIHPTIESDNVMDFLFDFEHLRTLKLAVSASLTENQLERLLKMKHLEDLTLNYSASTAGPTPTPDVLSHISHIAGGSSLTKLTLYVRSSLLDSLLCVFSEIPTLAQLSVHFVNEDENSFAWIGLAPFLHTWGPKWSTSLEKLTLQAGTGIDILDSHSRSNSAGTTNTYGSILPTYHRLKTFQIRQCDKPLKGFSDDIFWSITRAMPNLEVASFPTAWMISYNALQRVAIMCPDLVALQVGLSNDGFEKNFGATKIIPTGCKLQTLSVGNGSGGTSSANESGIAGAGPRTVTASPSPLGILSNPFAAPAASNQELSAAELVFTVARQLISLFPHLKKVDTSTVNYNGKGQSTPAASTSGSATGVAEFWKGVDRAIAFSYAVRMDQKIKEGMCVNEAKLEHQKMALRGGERGEQSKAGVPEAMRIGM